MNQYERHAERLDAADEACRARSAFTPFIESPRRELHPDGAKLRGERWYEGVLGGRIEGTGPAGSAELEGHERSPYTGSALRVRYARPSVDQTFQALARAWPRWRQASFQTRIGVCMEALARLGEAVFENAFATMHTTGQAFMMAFAGSGANSLDRGLEALVYARRAMADVPASARYVRTFGRSEATLEKRYRLVPRGPAIVITCGSYPAWNAYPAIMANLATGNPVVVKPHPTTILPVARAVQLVRCVLTEAGFDPNLLVLAPDTPKAPITTALVDDPRAAIVDFTGSPEYGGLLEARADRLVFTETAGCNAVILESATDLDAVLRSIANGLCLFSSQMCTAPQNIYIPAHVRTPEGDVPYPEVRRRLVGAVDALVEDPARAAAICGALHSERTSRRVDDLGRTHRERVLRRSEEYPHPSYSSARTRTPLLLEEPPEGTLHRGEQFGPIGFIIPTKDRDEAARAAAETARSCGAIATYGYSTDEAYRETLEERFFEAGASVGFNLIRHAPMNFTAAFSDYHVTGLNAAGNASLTDLAFVASRFRIVQSKTELPE